ncbi:quinolinate synthase, chloroplastic [Euphorbia lathyris]|uniref:quinolinate synthase, chloroplastic n=1 Tax=Euphorbia lathyris TaxID=212925 RepID=UPI0033139358
MDSSATISIKAYSCYSSPFSISSTHSPKPRIFPHKTLNYPSISFKPFNSVISSHNPNVSRFSCSAVTLSTSPTTDVVAGKLLHLVTEFQSIPESIDRVKRVLHYALLLQPFPDSLKVDFNRVMGCTAQVWIDAQLDQYGKMRFLADSDSEITRGFCACLLSVLDGAAPEEVLSVKTEDLVALNVGFPGAERSRVNTWHNVLVSMQKRTKKLVGEREGKKPFDPFPSLIVSSEGIQAKGSYAEAQARYLFPNESKVQELVQVLREKKIGVVAHFYMDPEVQGVLTAAQKEWPHIHISDSLVMADSAVKMAKAGCKFITVLGVDFMSENVRAILDQAGFGEIGVYRMSEERIGCSLADAASSPAYMNYLEAASESPCSLHVVYINTSLETKAYAHEVVPTITCTSSNVVQTILQAFTQISDLNVWYGPDSYMGANIAKLFQQMSMMTDDEIVEIHPAHNRDSIRSLLPRLHYYQDGTCIVHHLFGHEVVEKINEMYCDAFLTAHLEVPGEMFSLAMEAKRRGMGVVGSTQNILDFIKQRVQEAIDRNLNDHLQFVLGTESGMITAIVAAVRQLLGSAKSSGGAKINVEIVFPVSSDSITSTSPNSSADLKSVNAGDFVLPVVPGAASGEGCSIHGGCASCPYMKMNSLTSLLQVCKQLPNEKKAIAAYEAERFKTQTRSGKSIADVGCEPILHMRHFQTTKELPEKLVYQVINSNTNGGVKATS